MENRFGFFSRGQFYKKILHFCICFIIAFSLPAFSQDVININKPQLHNSLTLEDCIALALEYNIIEKISAEDVKIAGIQLKQARSAMYPDLSFSANFSYTDEDLVFRFPEQTFSLDMPPIQGFQFKGIKTEPFTVKLMDNKNLHTRISLKYPLYTGGKISSINFQAQKNFDISKYESSGKEREIIFDVKLYYYSYILASNLLKLCNETSEMLDATLNLTESLYLNGSGRVTKIDYLKNKVIVDQVKALRAEFEKNCKKSRESLVFITGNKLSPDFELSTFEISFIPLKEDITEVEKKIFMNNTDWMKINSAIEVYKAKSDEAKSGLFPSIGLYAGFDANFNEYEYGLVNKNNMYIASMGIGIEYDIFSGFRTKSAIEEAEAGLSKKNLEKDLLSETLKLRLKNIFHDLTACESNILMQTNALKTAEENRGLTERAFQQEMSDANELVQAQLMEALVKAQYQKALYEYAIEKARLELLSGINFQ